MFAGTAALQANRPCWIVVLFIPSSPCGAQTERAVKYTCMRSHTYAQPATHAQHTSPQHTRFSFSCLFLWPTLSVLSFFLSHYLCLLLPSLFQYPLSFSQLHMQSASLRSPHLPPSLSLSLSLSLALSLSLPPSIPLPLMQPLPPSPLLSLFSVCCARGHYLSQSGHVRWNGGVCSEQKQRELWGIVASTGSQGNSTVQQSSYQ